MLVVAEAEGSWVDSGVQAFRVLGCKPGSYEAFCAFTVSIPNLTGLGVRSWDVLGWLKFFGTTKPDTIP